MKLKMALASFHVPVLRKPADSDKEEIVLWPEKEKSLVEGISCDI